MNTYTVQLQFNVSSTDLADMQVQANSPEEAQQLARELYLDGVTLDYYASNHYESSITDNTAEWQVTVDVPTIADQVQSGTIIKCCWDCASKHRTQPPYDGTYTSRQGVCQICKQHKRITSASKLFGYHRFI